MTRALCLALTVFLGSACGAEHGATAHASVRGTTVDAATREPLAGVEVRAPGGLATRSDEHGRFALEGLTPGTEGELEASADDGRKGSLPLLPLKPGELEVVLSLR